VTLESARQLQKAFEDNVSGHEESQIDERDEQFGKAESSIDESR
jgi:hypothetical protein